MELPDPTHKEDSSAKRSPWNPPSPNGVVDPGVMDANHWPALSKATTKPPDPSSRPPDSAPAPVASSAVADSSSSQKHHGRHKPARRAGDHSPRDHPDRGAGGWDHGGGGGRGGQRNHNNGGGRRGNGYAGRRRGGYEGFYRGPPPMGMGPPYMRGAPPPMPVPPPFMGPPASHMQPFAGPMLFHEMPSPVSPVSPMYYYGPPPPPEALRGLPFATPMVGPPAYPYFLAPQPDSEADAEQNRAKLLKQIEFYFSKDNLCTDVFLRRKMDDQGWVDISLIAGFKKVRGLTNDLEYIKETIQSSSILEMQDDKIRRRNDWAKWVIPRESNPAISSSLASVTSCPGVKDLTVHLGGLDLHESASSSGMVDQSRHKAPQNESPSGDDQAPVAEDNSVHQ